MNGNYKVFAKSLLNPPTPMLTDLMMHSVCVLGGVQLDKTFFQDKRI